MFKKGKIIRNTKSFKVIEDKLLLVDQNGRLSIDDNFVDVDVDSAHYTLMDNTLIYVKGERTVIGAEGRTIEKTILLDSIVNGYALFSSELNVQDFTLRYELINIDNGEVLRDFGHWPIIKSTLSYGNYLFLNFGDKVLCLRITDSFEELWDLKMLSFGNTSVNKLIGCFSDQLFMACSNQKILVIDIDQADVHQLSIASQDLGLDHKYHKAELNSSTFRLDRNGQKLIGVFHTNYIEIEVATNKCHVFDLSNQLNKNGVRSFRSLQNSYFNNSYFFLTGRAEREDRKNIDLDCIVIVNRLNKKVDWIYVFMDEGIGTNSPMLKGEDLLQLDLEKNLHIFPGVPEEH